MSRFIGEVLALIQPLTRCCIHAAALTQVLLRSAPPRAPTGEGGGHQAEAQFCKDLDVHIKLCLLELLRLK